MCRPGWSGRGVTVVARHWAYRDGSIAALCRLAALCAANPCAGLRGDDIKLRSGRLFPKKKAGHTECLALKALITM